MIVTQCSTIKLNQSFPLFSLSPCPSLPLYLLPSLPPSPFCGGSSASWYSRKGITY